MDFDTILFITVAIIGGIALVYYVYNFMKSGDRPTLDSQPSVRSPRSIDVERRQHPRIDISWPVSMETPDGTIDAEVTNISLGGAFISCKKPFPIGQVFSLTMTGPDNEPVIATAEVVWSNANVPEEKVINRGMGVRFIKMSERHLQIVRQLFSSQPPVRSPRRIEAERRQHPRIDINWPVSMETPEGTINGEVKNISLGGAFISCKKPLPIGHAFSMTMTGPDNEPVIATAEVVWSNANVPEEKVINRGMGVRFIKMSEKHLQIVRQLFPKGE